MERRSRTQWERLRQVDDRQIDYSDIPPTTPEFWAPALLVRPSRKVPVSLRLDEDVLAWFRGLGAGYQTRLNAVLRAYVDRHAGGPRGIKEGAGSYTGSLLADLEAARERYEALDNLRALIGPRLLDSAERRIRADAERVPVLKLPVLFFVLVRRDPRELRQLDAFLGHLRRTPHRKRDLQNLENLVDRLRGETEYRHPVGALFEIEILRTLLDAASLTSVALYPRIGAGSNHADAAVGLGGETVYIEIKLLSQTPQQERVQDLATASSHGHPEPSLAEMQELGLHSVAEGVATHWGDPYGDALRVIGKLTEKPGQLHPDAPNVVCLGLADHWPDMISVEWAINAVLSGSGTIPEIAAGQTHDAAKADTLGRLAREAQPHPRLTGVLVFDARGGRASLLRAFRNPQPGPSNRLNERQWGSLLALFGFPGRRKRTARSPGRSRPSAGRSGQR